MLFRSLYLNIILNEKALNIKTDSKLDKFEEIKKLIKDNYKDLSDYDLVLITCNIHELDEKDLFDTLSKHIIEKLSNNKVDFKTRPFFLRLILLYLKTNNITEKILIDIRPCFDPVNSSEVLKKLFTDYYKNHITIEISSEDLGKLHSLNDQEIRDKLCTIFLKSDFIEEAEKKKLEEESKKPHTGYEISDFEVRVKKKDRKSTRLNSSHTDISRMPSSA